ncbi:MAG: hypothetical protein H0W84_08290 [Bacteroidetes bacterium]|nr:hypothetical protein [Bacteroidota bacterium]
MRKILLLILLVSIPFIVSSQSMKGKKRGKSVRGFANNKKKPRKEYILGIGASNFLGELGGADQTGTFFAKDLEFSETKTSAALGMRYKFNKRMALKGGLYYQMVSGADKLTTEPYRQNRNLSFRSNIFELSIQYELYLTKEQQGHLYKIKNAKGMKTFDLQAYVFVGAGGFYFNPKAFYNGRWRSLQPLGTEGQGLPGGGKKYSRVSVCIPYGIGAKDAINKDWGVGLEVGIRKTFTDYIDDVSTVYYDNNALKAAHGQMGADLADPSHNNYPAELGGNATGLDQTAPGQVRGHSNHKDAYMFINITVAYKVPYKRRTRSKF